MENIVSFNAVSTSKVKYTSNASATKNIKNVNLLDSMLTNQEKNINVLEENANIELTDNPLAEYTFEELLKEGQETKKEVQLQRDKKAVQEAVEVIDKIGEVNLSSGPDIEAAKAAYANLTEEQKALIDPKYLEKIEAAEAELKRQQIEEERRRKEEEAAARQAKLDELEALYKARDENNGLFHPIREAEIEAAIRELEAELDVPHQPDGWEKFTDTVEDAAATVATYVESKVETAVEFVEDVVETAATVSLSIQEGVLNVAETIVDGTVQIVGGTAAYVVGAIDKEAGDAMKQGIQSFVSTDLSGAYYDFAVSTLGIDEDIAYGFAHTAGSLVGNVAGYAAITIVTGGTGSALLGAVAAAGSTAETAYANGASFNEAYGASLAAGVIGGVAGGMVDKIGVAAKGTTSLLGVAGRTTTGALVGAAEPLATSYIEYKTYGNNDGKSYSEYMNDNGGWLNVAIGGLSGGVSVGTQGVKGYSDLKDLETKGYSIESELDYRKNLKSNGYNNIERAEISIERRNSYDSWKNECDAYGGWATKNTSERFAKMDSASLALDSDGTIDAENFWKLKGNKDLRVENPVYSKKSMKQLEEIKNSGSVEVYLTEDQFKDYKLEYSRKGVKYDGRIDSDGHTRVYCTKLDSSQNSITSSKDLGDILGTGWEDNKKLYRGTLNSSTVTYSSGLEASANPDWIPGGYTLNVKNPNGLGTPDLVLKDYKLDPNNYKLIN